MLAGSTRKTLTAAALAAVLAIPAAAETEGSHPSRAGWLRQALGWLTNPVGWVAAALADAADPAPPAVSDPRLRASVPPPAEGTDAGHSVDPNGEPRQ